MPITGCLLFAAYYSLNGCCVILRLISNQSEISQSFQAFFPNTVCVHHTMINWWCFPSKFSIFKTAKAILINALWRVNGIVFFMLPFVWTENAECPNCCWSIAFEWFFCCCFFQRKWQFSLNLNFNKSIALASESPESSHVKNCGKVISIFSTLSNSYSSMLRKAPWVRLKISGLAYSFYLIRLYTIWRHRLGDDEHCEIIKLDQSRSNRSTA